MEAIKWHPYKQYQCDLMYQKSGYVEVNISNNLGNQETPLSFWPNLGRGWLKFSLMSSALSTCFYKIIPHRVWSKFSLERSQLNYEMVAQIS